MPVKLDKATCRSVPAVALVRPVARLERLPAAGLLWGIGSRLHHKNFRSVKPCSGCNWRKHVRGLALPIPERIGLE
jgi:hypothetical protein